MAATQSRDWASFGVSLPSTALGRHLQAAMPFLSEENHKSQGTVLIPDAQGPIPFLGSVPLVDPELPSQSLQRLARQYGEIYRFVIPGRQSPILVSTHALVNELCDEKRFKKKVAAALLGLREAIHDGLFTAHNDEPNWGIAHRILMPAFGPMAIKGMFDEMHDVASQMILKWARHGSTTPIMVSDDFTRLTLDTIALCSMGYRFNSFYHDSMHEFIEAMTCWMKESGNKTRRLLPDVFYRTTDRKWHDDAEILRRTADEVLKARKENPSGRKDLLTAMIEGVDPKTGGKLSDSSIIDNLITFLIAGHETTSGMLSFAFYLLLKNPTAYRKAQQEIDDLCGREPITVEHLSKMPYITAVLRETLRLYSTIPAFVVEAIEDTVVGGKYAIPKNHPIFLMIAESHRDPKVYGDDAQEFKPERMLDGQFERRNREFPNSWKPFGNGMRGCIGRAFAWQEALLITAMLLQNFNFVMHDPAYQLSIKENLTLKPDNFYMRAILRHGMSPTELERSISGVAPTGNKTPPRNATRTSSPDPEDGGIPMSIYYGSNSGTCESLAHKLAVDASAQGFKAETVDVLDAANQKLPAGNRGPVVLITASYEGLPPDNAKHFVEWLENLKGGDELVDTSYAVFGCGHQDWTKTFHRIPKLVDEKLAEHGAVRLAPLGLSNAAHGDMFVDFETWEFEILWPALADRYKTGAGRQDAAATDLTVALSQLSVEVSHPRAADLRQDVGEAVVVAARDLTAPGAPPKRHMEIRLPKTGGRVHYSAGDYLAVLPVNPKSTVERAMRRFGLAWDAHVTIRSGGRTTLPTGAPVSAREVLSSYVELTQPATKRGIAVLAGAVTGGPAAEQEQTKAALLDLAGDSYAVEVSAKRVGVLDLLERFPACAVPFGTFLALLPPMRVRQYSISSSPLWNDEHATLTYSVLSAPSLADPARTHVGVASSYLAGLGEGDHLHVALRPSHVAFRLPSPETPVVCICAGSGMAPFRAFAQERAALVGAGRKVAPLLLFFGCREPGVDDLYREELEGWEAKGVLSVRRAYSRRTEQSEGCRYVQDRLLKNRAEVKSLWSQDAKVFVCGSREVAEGVKEAMFKVVAGKEGSSEEVQAWYEEVRNVRYASDIFD
ncbi:hypothetical protein PoMZ_05916 [Pyricularia oryzae]|uniref:Bifunctional cytochrome P450/NADPH--P450 reductase n=1 Tax=Pyricularia oryzae TaxID=318829 RepID=A0A4P7NPX1_PYROR|nr:hypothetical protein MCOR13_006832 [Pyricularia oryzae]QBZ64222.1 hypothetical protein PoMZ_05916 [Pyricularia oryzae]